MLYMVTFTINIHQMLAYIPYMDPMGYGWSNPIRRLVKRAAPSPRRCALTRQTCLRQEISRIFCGIESTDLAIKSFVWGENMGSSPSKISMDWLKGKSTGNHRFSHEIWGFPVNFPLNQSIENWDWSMIYPWKIRDFHHRNFWWQNHQNSWGFDHQNMVSLAHIMNWWYGDPMGYWMSNRLLFSGTSLQETVTGFLPEFGFCRFSQSYNSSKVGLNHHPDAHLNHHLPSSKMTKMMSKNDVNPDRKPTWSAGGTPNGTPALELGAPAVPPRSSGSVVDRLAPLLPYWPGHGHERIPDRS